MWTWLIYIDNLDVARVPHKWLPPAFRLLRSLFACFQAFLNYSSCCSVCCLVDVVVILQDFVRDNDFLTFRLVRKLLDTCAMTRFVFALFGGCCAQVSLCVCGVVVVFVYGGCVVCGCVLCVLLCGAEFCPSSCSCYWLIVSPPLPGVSFVAE